MNKKNTSKRHVISVLMENKFGTLARISGLFSGRGYNIESLTVNATENKDISNMTIVTCGEDPVIEQIIKQLRKLINVLRVRDVTELAGHIEREMALVKLHLPAKQRTEVFGLAEVFRARVVNMTHDSTIIEITGSEEKIDSFIELVRPYGLIEVVKTGVLAMGKGASATTDNGQNKNLI